MSELWIKYVDHEGSDQRLLIDKDEFVIGRHTAADLCFPDTRLSREHVRIELVDDEYLASDCGSTNGTLLNGTELDEPTKLHSGDELDLGGGLQVMIEFHETPVSETAEAENIEPPAPEISAPAAEPTFAPPAAVAVPSHRPESSFSAGIFIAAAVFGVLLVGILGVLIYVFSSNGEAKSPSGNDFVYTKDRDNDPPTNRKKSTDPTPTGNKTADDDPPANGTTDVPANTNPGKDLRETAKTEQNAAMFLRKIAQNDPKAFLTTAQAKIVNDKIKQISGSSALIDNINSARKNAAQIKTLAAAKNLKPQFLATAAIAKLGSSRGDVLQTAQGIADVFAKLSIEVNNELFEDALLMVAAYDQGAAGDYLKLRNMLQNLATQYPESSRSIRTIWFLHEKGKITDSEYDFAVRFLATGTIAQNPKDFNVNCEAFSF